LLPNIAQSVYNHRLPTGTGW